MFMQIIKTKVPFAYLILLYYTLDILYIFALRVFLHF